MRNSLDMVLFNISRPILRKLDIAFKSGLTRIQWLSMDLDMYLEYVEEQLIEATDLVKRINNIKRFHIEEIIKSIKDFQLIDLPKEPMDISLLLEQNVNHRKIIGKFSMSLFARIEVKRFCREADREKIPDGGKSHR